MLVDLFFVPQLTTVSQLQHHQLTTATPPLERCPPVTSSDVPLSLSQHLTQVTRGTHSGTPLSQQPARTLLNAAAAPKLLASARPQLLQLLQLCP
jgi:hypothetical protein